MVPNGIGVCRSIVEHDSNDIITLMLVVTKNQRPPPPLRRFPDERTLKPRTGSQYPGRITMVKVPVINIQGPFQNREMISDLKEIVEHTKLEYGTDRGFARAFTDGIMGGMMMSGIVTMKIGREVEEAVYNQCLANLERRPDRLFRLEHVLYPRTARSTMDVPDEQVMGSIWARLVEDTCRRLYSP